MENLVQSIRNAKHNGIPKSTVTVGFENVTFEYEKNETVFESANFSFSNNGLVLFKGCNGTGKTTIFKLLTKFKNPKSGTVSCDDSSIIGYSSANGSDINSYIKCDSFLSDCLENWEEQYLSSVLDFLNLQKSKDHRMLELSSGQRKKLSIFRALTKSQYAIFLDEPLSFLDVSFQQTVVDNIKQLKETMSILIATHTDKFDDIADYIYEIQNKNINKLINKSNE